MVYRVAKSQTLLKRLYPHTHRGIWVYLFIVVRFSSYEKSLSISVYESVRQGKR